MRLSFTIIALMLFGLAGASTFVFGNSSPTVVTATLSVTCPFSITLSPSSTLYDIPQNVVVDYSVETLTQCGTSGSGNFVITNSITSNVVYSTTLALGSLGQIPTNGEFTADSSSMGQGSYTATLDLSSSDFSNSSFATFQVTSPANVEVVSSSVSPTSPNVGDPLIITTNVVNYGTLASSNMILNLKVTGPGAFTYLTNQSIASLSPSQGELTSFSVGGITPSTGTYTMQQNVSYQTTITQNSIPYTINQISGNYTSTYTVSQGGGGGGGGSGGRPAPTPVPTNSSSLTFTELPLVSSVLVGNGTLANIGLRNTGTAPIWVNITVPKISYGILSVSSNSIYLTSNSSQSVQMLFIANKNTSLSSYIAQINYTVTIVGGQPTYGQFYTEFNIFTVNQSKPQVLRTSYAEGPSKSIVSQLEVYNPTNKTIYNMLVSTQLPSSIASSNFKATLSGGVYNITKANNEYVMKWTIPQLQPRTSTILTYSVSNLTSPVYFYSAITSLSTISPSNSTRLRVFSISAPTFYVGKAGNITIGAIYVGTNQTTITFQLSPPAGVAVKDQVQKFSAYQNTVMNPIFQVEPIRASGTYIFQIFIGGIASNQSFTVPIIVLQNSTTTTTVPGNILSLPQINTNYAQAATYVIVGSVIILAVMAYLIYKRFGGSRYNSDRAARLIRMKQKVKRESEEEQSR